MKIFNQYLNNKTNCFWPDDGAGRSYYFFENKNLAKGGALEVDGKCEIWESGVPRVEDKLIADGLGEDL